MGLQENGNMEMGLSLGGKNKYRRMDDDSELKSGDDFGEDYDAAQHHRQMQRSKTTRKYVFACSIFASLNSVLLGYGEQILILDPTLLFDVNKLFFYLSLSSKVDYSCIFL